MKKLLLLAVFLMCSITATFGATHTVRVANFRFSPSAINAVVGDVIVWRWVIGHHTTTSTSVPAGARTWNARMNSTSTRFRYVLRVAGTYQYECTFHPAEMQGTITVSRGTESTTR
jgi:plastocyanin